MSNEMNTRRHIAIGAYELKRSYQRNMALAVLSVALFWALCVAAGGVLGHGQATIGGADILEPDLTIYINMAPPPSVVEEPTDAPAENSASPATDFALVAGADDAEVTNDFQMLDARKLNITPPAMSSGNGLGSYYVATAAEPIPNPTEFVPTDKQPEPLNLPAATYPDMARRAGIEGTVWLQVYIDRRGRVKKVMVAQESGAEVGFEEAAIEAAWQGEWAPAEQNGRGVGVWVRYPVRFTLH